MNIDILRDALLKGCPVEYTAHCQKRMLERDINRADIRNCILNGEIIEEYPLSGDQISEKSYPSCLILGKKISEEKQIHVVVGYNDKSFLIISACYPDLLHWNADYKTRR